MRVCVSWWVLVTNIHNKLMKEDPLWTRYMRIQKDIWFDIEALKPNELIDPIVGGIIIMRSLRIP